MKDVALSTMWGTKNFDTLDEFFRQGTALGFTRFELNHAIDSEMLVGMNGYRIASVHEPCPADVSMSELKERDWLISSLNEDKRRHGILAIKRSIDLAYKLGAPAVMVGHVHLVQAGTAGDVERLVAHWNGRRDRW